MTPSDRFNVTENLFEIRFKKNGQYNVEGLPAGMDAQPGFWELNPFSHSDYEIRFCASHEDAVEYGTPFAEEITAEKTKSRKDNPTLDRGRGRPLEKRSSRFLDGRAANRTSGPGVHWARHLRQHGGPERGSRRH